MPTTAEVDPDPDPPLALSGFEQAAAVRDRAVTSVAATATRIDRAVILCTSLLKIDCCCEQHAIKQHVKGPGTPRLDRRDGVYQGRCDRA
ncbi:hypothetical protein GCM10010504_37340 [Streptomyces griseus]|nr:hypothetical protein GCM10010504_37340 [Streptomyces griseus]